MKKLISHIAPALALLVATVGTTTLHADTFDRLDPPVVASGAEGGPTVNVMNNYDRQVSPKPPSPAESSVYVVDSQNRRHLLGKVGHSRFKDLQIPAGLTRGTGTVQLKVYPVQLQPGIGVSVFESAGVKTRVLSVQSDQVIVLYLEQDLTRSRVGMVSS